MSDVESTVGEDVRRLVLSVAGVAFESPRAAERSLVSVRGLCHGVVERWGGREAVQAAATMVDHHVNEIREWQPPENARFALRLGMRTADSWVLGTFGDSPPEGRMPVRTFLEGVAGGMWPETPEAGAVAECLLGELAAVLSVTLMMAATPQDQRDVSIRHRPRGHGLTRQEAAEQDGAYSREWAAVMAVVDRLSVTSPADRAMPIAEELGEKIEDLLDQWGVERVQASFLAVLGQVFARARTADPAISWETAFGAGLTVAEMLDHEPGRVRAWVGQAVIAPQTLALGPDEDPDADDRLVLGLVIVTKVACLEHDLPLANPPGTARRPFARHVVVGKRRQPHRTSRDKRRGGR